MNIEEKYDIGYLSGIVILLVIFMWWGIFNPKTTLTNEIIFLGGFGGGLVILAKTWFNRWDYIFSILHDKKKPIYVGTGQDAFMVFDKILSKKSLGDKTTLQLTKVNKNPSSSRIRKKLPGALINKRYKIEILN